MEQKLMNKTCLFSIIIPVYNGTNVVSNCLNSIYTQNINNEVFEVICVDDCSTDKQCLQTLEEYCFEGKRPSNLRILKHEINKRQGAARNTGVTFAKGKWVVYIDCDDVFVKDGLVNLCDCFRNNDDLDIIVYNYSNAKTKRCIDNLDSEKMDGNKFLQTQPIPWIACCYAYKRNFLIENDIKFVEGVFYEDCDYNIRAILVAKKMQFIDIPVFFYNIYEGQTSKLDTPEKIEDILRLTIRLKEMGLKVMNYNALSGEAILNHQWFQYYSTLKRYLWRLPSHYMYLFLKKYKPYAKGRGFLEIVPKFPMTYVIIATLMKPFLYVAERIYKMKKN